VGASCGLLSHLFVVYLGTVSALGGLVMCTDVSHVVDTYLSICAGPVALSAAAMLMMITRTVHYPAGGTAVSVALAPDTFTCLSVENIICLGPEAMTLLANVFCSSSALVTLACILHRGAYPYSNNNVKKLRILEGKKMSDLIA
jgi:CBS-domain-containing membrane protein